MGVKLSATEDILIEIGCEELPAGEQPQLIQDFVNALTQGLQDYHLSFADINQFITPRRLAVIIKQLELKQADRQETRRGPAVAIAYDSGKLTPAALGFAKSCGIELNKIKQVNTDKGDYLSAEIFIKGQPSKKLLPQLLNQIIPKLPRGKTMRWGVNGGGDEPTNEYRFVRPIRWLLALIGKEVLPWQAYGLNAGKTTMGHSFYTNKPIEIKHPDEYEVKLEKEGQVIATAYKRQASIIKQIKEISSATEYSSLIDEDKLLDNELLAELVAITEYPVAYLAEFDKKYLQLPSELLESVLTLKQRYIPLVDKASKMSNKFVFVANIKSKDKQLLVEGNQAVVRPRLEDADFFYRQDLLNPLSNRLEQLDKVALLAGLGNMRDKSRRGKDLAMTIAGNLKQEDADKKVAGLAAELCKCDLTSLMVQEFPELQGTMGGYYLSHQGTVDDYTKEEVTLASKAIGEHYMPRHSDDNIPSTLAGEIVAIADRTDVLLGFFHLGRKPSGEKDPFALRRVALGLARIIIESNLSLELEAILKHSQQLYKKHNNIEIKDEIIQQVLGFIKERVVVYGKGKQLSTENLDAVFYQAQSNLYNAWRKVEIIEEYPNNKMKQLVEMNKRIKNIIGKYKIQLTSINALDETLLSEKEEKALLAMINKLQQDLTNLLVEKKYKESLDLLGQLKLPLDNFFDAVMVMADDKRVRENRLLLLSIVQDMLLQVADFSRINSDL